MKATKKYYKGVEVPYIVNQVIMIYKDNRNSLWRDTMVREINGIDILIRFLPYDNKESIPKDYKFTPVHFVFDVKHR